MRGARKGAEILGQIWGHREGTPGLQGPHRSHLNRLSSPAGNGTGEAVAHVGRWVRCPVESGGVTPTVPDLSERRQDMSAAHKPQTFLRGWRWAQDPHCFWGLVISVSYVSPEYRDNAVGVLGARPSTSAAGRCTSGPPHPTPSRHSRPALIVQGEEPARLHQEGASASSGSRLMEDDQKTHGKGPRHKKSEIHAGPSTGRWWVQVGGAS